MDAVARSLGLGQSSWRSLVGSSVITTTSVATIICTIFYGYHLHLSIPRKGEAPVLWSWLPFIGSAINMGVDPVGFLLRNAKRFGDIFGFVVVGHRTFIIADPHSHAVIFKPVKELSYREFHNMVLINFFGNLPSTIRDYPYDADLGRKWFSMYLLSDGALGKLTQRMQVYMHKNVTGMKPCVVDLYDFVSRVIFKASFAAVVNDAAADDDHLYDAFMLFDEHMALAAGGLKIDYFNAANAARQKLLDGLRKFRDGNCELQDKRWDLFDKWERKKYATKRDSEAYQLSIVWASVGNTMPGTFWVLFYLLSYPDALERVQREMEAVSATAGAEYSQEQLNGMTYTDACITESLRLSTGSLIMRHCNSACELTLSSGRKYKFRAGDRVGLAPPIHHHDPEIFPDPEMFKPERWLVGQTPEELLLTSQGKMELFKGGKKIEGNTGYLAFGGGVNYCPGRRFARNEIKTLLAYLVKQYKFRFAPPPESTTSGETGPEYRPPYPGHDGARAGIGIFPPKGRVYVHVETTDKPAVAGERVSTTMAF